MSSTGKRYTVAVVVRDIEKRYQPVRCYKFVLEVQWSDQSRYVVYRSYSEFLELHMLLMDTFPIEAGVIDPEDRVLPKLSGPSLFSREVQKIAERRRTEISDYCNRLMTLQTKISQFQKLLEFFELRDEDLNVPQDSKTKKTSTLKSLGRKLKKNKRHSNEPPGFNDLKVTSPLQLQQYVSIGQYKAAGKGQINLQAGDHVDVIDKNTNGWWYVSCDGIEGWAPATYLDRLSPGDIETDEVLCLAGENFLTMKEYKAQYEDEISFDSAVVVEVLNKVLDGWWIASYNGNVGYVPSTYLKPYNNPYLKSSSLQPKQKPTNSPLLPTPRRQTIKNPSASRLPDKRDLQPYRRATEKRRQRSIKQQKHETGTLQGLSLILETDSDYLTPAQRTSDLSPDYVDPNAMLPQNRLSDSSADSAYLCPEKPAHTQVVPAVHMNVSREVSDANVYEPVHTYDLPPPEDEEARPDIPKRTSGGHRSPTYLAPPVPMTKSAEVIQSPAPTAAPRSNIIVEDAAKTSEQPPLKPARGMVVPPPSSADSSTSNEYEVVCDKSAATSGTAISSSSKPINKVNAARLKIKVKVAPPPRPDDSQLTTLSRNASHGHHYSPFSEGSANNTPSPSPSPIDRLAPRSPNVVPAKPAPAQAKTPPPRPDDSQLTMLSRNASHDYHYLPLSEDSANNSHCAGARLAPKSPNITSTKPASPRLKTPSAGAPVQAPRRQPVRTPPTMPEHVTRFAGSDMSAKLNSLQPKPIKDLPPSEKSKTLVGISEKNNNDNRDAGKIYEEVLVKPSQLKGQKNAQVRQPK